MNNTFNHEPTLYDVMDILVTMDGRFTGIETKLEGVDSRLNGIDSRLDGVDSRFDLLEENMTKGFIATHNRIDILDEHVEDLTQAVSKLSLQFTHLEGTVDDHTEYIEDNAEKMSKHDSRIKKLEIKLAI